MDLSYFEAALPVADDILNIVIAVGWALLLGNLVFQAAKSMMSGFGFEGEDPKTLFARTFVFAFLLLASRQICEIGLGISNEVITMLQVPDSVSVSLPGEDFFSIGASWLLAIIVGFVLMWQIIKLFFAVGERYFLVGLLTLLSPWAFAMGGSRNTADIFKGWARMFATMCLMMVINVVFLKMLLSAMGNIPSDAGVVPWLIFVVAITRMAKKIDAIITRIGLNPSQTGGQGRGLPGMLSFMVLKAISSNVIGAAGGSSGNSKTPSGSRNGAGGSQAGNNRTSNRNNTSNRGKTQNNASSQNSNNSTSKNSSQKSGQNSGKDSNRAANDAGGKQPGGAATPVSAQNTGAAGTTPGGANTPSSSTSPGSAGKTQSVNRESSAKPGAAGTTHGGPTPPVNAVNLRQTEMHKQSKNDCV